MISTQQSSGRLVLALATLFALFLFAGCEEEQTGPSAATNAGLGSAEILGDALGAATNSQASISSLNAEGASANSQAWALLHDSAGVAPLSAAPPFSSPFDFYSGTISHTANCPANGTVALNGTGGWNHDFDVPPFGYGTYTASVSDLNAVFSNCSNFFHRFNGTATLNATNSFSKSQVGGGVDHWEFSADNAFRGNIQARDNQTLVEYNIVFSYAESGTIVFDYNTSTDVVTNSVLNYTVTISVNGQTCTGSVTVVGPNQQQGSWACSG